MSIEIISPILEVKYSDIYLRVPRLYNLHLPQSRRKEQLDLTASWLKDCGATILAHSFNSEKPHIVAFHLPNQKKVEQIIQEIRGKYGYASVIYNPLSIDYGDFNEIEACLLVFPAYKNALNDLQEQYDLHLSEQKYKIREEGEESDESNYQEEFEYEGWGFDGTPDGWDRLYVDENQSKIESLNDAINYIDNLSRYSEFYN
ncbi:hypothetical protein IQ265_28215 [Nodosilinea sp. LEGE 06152]|uniref:hypothetical protein n=1 Tax=Nodosilinea sp. LEGE 06152 TaxID=2777966 RepID=UPI001882D6B1|nr:hypothetical protein [Nodosilinea sp. LEGE 06152]MBE9160678.1 hypothetical protein [Nodosilinea sp. LEGE 06152]